ncbi:NADH-quinone oxidoreductase subunit N [Desulfuribacillus alkaliarsenatis]|uniref:NADH-quinone oxidoreductase subunit N n=1 Tax=Desulfuribacillus alkaliarsenatis TaxID=766136 RepID=A0A1E5G1J6_9FIRM|nr:NADH-quinone oxidoreductase subunit N [Desulfuribacillus alkaliarsenatis]OEF96789.1 NADH-quinone oxidoreductase subunit N [Desulfuribacillus alkaliarsenatis]
MSENVFNADWSLMTPEIVLVAFGLLILIIDFMTGVRGRKISLGMMSVFAIVVTMVLVISDNRIGTIGHTFVLDPFAVLFKTVILAGVGLVILISMSYMEKHKDIYQGEFYYLLLFAAAGAMLMTSSADLITLYIGLEILSISSYCLAGFRKNYVKSNEAAMKYVILGGVASAFILYGMSFIYGLIGSTSLLTIGQQIPQVYADYPFLVIMSVLFMLVGFGFKISVVPFHMWAPDVYEGAPTPITAFLTVVSKVAAFAILLRVFSLGFGGIFSHWYFYIAAIAAVTMIVGNVVALTQTNIKRLMAYSGIAQAGYLLVPLAAPLAWDVTLSQIMFYAVAYLFMTIGAFAVITLVTDDRDSEELSSFAGLAQRSPFLAFAMTVFLVSLAGLPITAGFIGKFYIFLGVMATETYWLAIIMAITSIISFYYYFGIIKQMYMRPTEESKLVPSTSLSVVVAIALIGTIGLGLLPGFLMDILTASVWMQF